MATMSHFYGNTTLHVFMIWVPSLQLVVGVCACTEIVHTAVPTIWHAPAFDSSVSTLQTTLEYKLSTHIVFKCDSCHWLFCCFCDLLVAGRPFLFVSNILQKCPDGFGLCLLNRTDHLIFRFCWWSGNDLAISGLLLVMQQHSAKRKV